jgi:hypothetical protein
LTASLADSSKAAGCLERQPAPHGSGAVIDSAAAALTGDLDDLLRRQEAGGRVQNGPQQHDQECDRRFRPRDRRSGPVVPVVLHSNMTDPDDLDALVLELNAG